MTLFRPEDVRPLIGVGLAAVACLTLNAVPASRGPAIQSSAWDAVLADARTIDVNQANARELERLPGVGRVLAGRIVRDRDARGPFAGPGDLLRVPGVGPKTLESIEHYLNYE
jgi:competence ComEA-like helix-hairpin-helix protein